MIEPMLAWTARIVLWRTEASRSWIFGMRVDISTSSLSVPSLKTRSSSRCVEARRSSSIWWKAPASWPISATWPRPGRRAAASFASGTSWFAEMGPLMLTASRAIWSTSRRKTTNPRQAMTRAMKAANWASVLVMSSETERKATKSSSGSRATRTKMTAAASRRLIALDTKPGSFIGGSVYCRIPADVSARELISQISHEREIHAQTPAQSPAQSIVAQGSPEIRGLYHRGRRPDPRYLDGPGHRDRRQGHRRPGYSAAGRRHGHPGLRCPPREGRTIPDRRRDLRFHRKQRAEQGRRAAVRPGRLLRDRPRALPPGRRHAGQELPADGRDLREGHACPVPRRHRRRRRLRQAAAVGAGGSAGRDGILRRGGPDAPLRRGIPGGRGRCSVVRSPQAHVFRRAGRGCL